MNSYESKARKIRERYTEGEASRIGELKSLDKRVKRPARIFGYIYGTAGALILGTGMCLAMKVIGSAVIPGIAIGCVGIGMVSSTYAIYDRILARRRKRYASEIIKLSDSIIGDTNKL